MRRASAWLGRAADVLTLIRLGMAVALVATLAAGWLAAAAALLAGAWLTDALDGPVARASGLRTRLGRFDLVIDTAVGAGVLAGLALAGDVPAGVAWALLAGLGVGFLVLRNPVLSMTLQAIGYGWLLWTLWDHNEPALWLPLGTATGLLLLLHRRLFRTVIPAFVSGLATMTRRRNRFERL